MALEEAVMELQTEKGFFEKHLDRLIREHEGKYALIKCEQLVGTFDTAENAYVVGVQKFGGVPFLVKHISREESVAHIPALELGLLRAHV